MNKDNIVSRCIFAPIPILVSCLILLCVLCGQISAQDFKTVKPGIEYAEVTKEISGLKVNMNLLRLDLTKVRLDVHHAMDAAIGTEKTSSIATRHGAFAAINAGFFRLDTSTWVGDPAGALVSNGRLMSESSNDRVALDIFDDDKSALVNISHFRISAKVKFGSFTVSEVGINRERKDNDFVIYTPDFGRLTLTNQDGAEIVVGKDLRIISIKSPGGNSFIPDNGFVLSATGKRSQELLAAVKEKIRVDFIYQIQNLDTEPEILTTITTEHRKKRSATIIRGDESIVAGVPQLIEDGKIKITWEREKSSKSFVETRHPRTAVAKLKDGKFLMITVDGRTESSGGIGLQDLAEYLLSLGATDAMNLDGGGSTTMFLDGKVVNHPSDKEGERKVSDAILVTPRGTKIRK